MRLLRCSLAVLLLAAPLAETRSAAAQTPPDNDPGCRQASWGPYDPKPGHPTAAERREFLDKIKPLAVEAEDRFKIPAAAIAAMAVQESGFGFTRTALNANNLFGYKAPSSASGNLRVYTLACQPASDPGKDYRVFKDFEDAFLFVSERLANGTRYRKITAEYAAIPRSARKKQDVIDWVARIAKAGYNCCPDHYKIQVSRTMNDPLHPGDVEGEQSLYRLSLQP